MFELKQLEKDYARDATFHKVVDLFYDLMVSHGVTPVEFRQALFLAQYKYDVNHARPIVEVGDKFPRDEWTYGEVSKNVRSRD